MSSRHLDDIMGNYRAKSLAMPERDEDDQPLIDDLYEILNRKAPDLT